MRNGLSIGDYPLNHSESQGLPPYKFRRSKRAKRLQIRVLPTGKVEVVLPQGCSKKQGHALVQERADWIAKALQKIAGQKTNVDTDFPLTLDLFAINETWEILRESDRHPTQVGLHEKEGALILSGVTAQDALCLNVLKKWLIQKGKRELIPWLDNISHKVKLPYHKASVRVQKTRWGSCSSEKNISLNCKLLFLSPEQVRYLFIHELSHTRHMNHSKGFWTLVEKLEPDYKRLDTSLRHAMRDQVPGWLSQ